MRTEASARRPSRCAPRRRSLHWKSRAKGLVTGLASGTGCPALHAQLGEYTVTRTASTPFVGGSCRSIAVGRKLDVRGTMTGEKTATASPITFKN